MAVPDTSAPPAAIESLHCSGCQYPLDPIAAASAACPECGTPIATSRTALNEWGLSWSRAVIARRSALAWLSLTMLIITAIVGAIAAANALEQGTAWGLAVSMGALAALLVLTVRSSWVAVPPASMAIVLFVVGPLRDLIVDALPWRSVRQLLDGSVPASMLVVLAAAGAIGTLFAARRCIRRAGRSGDISSSGRPYPWHPWHPWLLALLAGGAVLGAIAGRREHRDVVEWMVTLSMVACVASLASTLIDLIRVLRRAARVAAGPRHRTHNSILPGGQAAAR